jgi:hypothetical protein
MKKRRKNDHLIATITRFTLAGVGILAGMLIIRSVPDLIRYVKMERM